MSAVTRERLFYDYVMSFLHVPYRWGGSNPNVGLDCSGLVVEILTAFDVLPHNYDTTALGLWRRFGNHVAAPDVVFGDLVFFGPTERTISHVGLCLSNCEMLEAGGGNATTIETQIAHRQNARVRIRPIDNRRDIIGFKRPEYSFSVA